MQTLGNFLEKINVIYTFMYAIKPCNIYNNGIHIGKAIQYLEVFISWIKYTIVIGLTIFTYVVWWNISTFHYHI